MELPEKAILYVGDVMCSWCYGFAPVIDRLYKEYSDKIPMFVVLGGLRPGPNAQQLDSKLKRMLNHHWEEVEKATQQPFNYSFLDQEDFLYDTEYSSRAVISAAAIDPTLKLEYYSRLQKAFYKDGKDPTSTETFLEIAKELSINQKQFAEIFASDEIKRKTVEEFQLSQALQVQGFPTLVYLEGKSAMHLTRGYAPYDWTKQAMDAVISKGLALADPEQAKEAIEALEKPPESQSASKPKPFGETTGDFCEPGGVC